MNETDQTSPSEEERTVILRIAPAGVTLEMSKGISAFELYGLAGFIETQARIMHAAEMQRQQAAAGGLVIPS